MDCAVVLAAHSCLEDGLAYVPAYLADLIALVVEEPIQVRLDHQP
jgi:hypothetical protein